jgi:hypothetical protein
VDSNAGKKGWISGGYFDSGYVGCRIGDHAVIRFLTGRDQVCHVDVAFSTTVAKFKL